MVASGRAEGNGFGPDINGEARSRLAIVFQLAGATPYSVDGTVKQEMLDGFTHVWLVHQDTSATVFFFTDLDELDSSPTSFSQSGVLDPGSYELIANSFACGGETEYCGGTGFTASEYSFLFTVPEPASAGLLALGLAALAASGRRRRRGAW